MKSFIVILQQAAVISEHLQHSILSEVVWEGDRSKYLPQGTSSSRVRTIKGSSNTPGKYWIKVENYGYGKSF